MQEGNKILDSNKITKATLRIAYQIFESNMKKNQIFLVGISSNGIIFSKKIAKKLKEISTIKVETIELKLDKKNPRKGIKIGYELNNLKDRSIVVIDDVLDTGRTLLYAVNAFLKIPLEQIQTVVLVNRNHKKFPIKADFKGISLSTSVKEHIDVIFFPKNKEGVYLS